MFIKIWNFLLGYVMIHMSGFSVERLINRAAAAGIVFWDVGRLRVAVSVKVSRRDYGKLQQIAERTGTKLTVERFVGLPTIIGRFKKRVVLLVGCVLFVVGLVVLTSFIWRIDISGTDRIDPEEMLEFLAESGFDIGTFRHGIAYRDVESLLMAQFDDIAWVSLVIEGTAAHIRLVETIEQPEIVDLSTPTDIVAAKDGIIVEMATSLGTPLFVPGDVVREGEVLVSGRLAIGVEGEEITHEYVRARSEVWARLYYSINFDIPLVFYEKTFTGRTRRVYSIIIGSRELTLPHRRHNFIYYEAITEHGQLALGENYPLPLGYAVTENFEMVRHLQRRTVAEAVALGKEMVAGRIAEELPESAMIVTQELDFREQERTVTMRIFLVTIERIDMEKTIDFNIN
ncbi:MAG: sporulation protein YqfD [Clostridiales bacterium]|jgi:similar to stage IV sporulation protein|nr:sporulation protein YqfD [Clostridiales bacterium]